MRIYIYSGGEHLVAKSGVGQAIRHQREMLRRAGVETTDRWSGDAWAIHINTVLPDILPAVFWARLTGRKAFSAFTDHLMASTQPGLAFLPIPSRYFRQSSRF